MPLPVFHIKSKAFANIFFFFNLFWQKGKVIAFVRFVYVVRVLSTGREGIFVFCLDRAETLALGSVGAPCQNMKMSRMETYSYITLMYTVSQVAILLNREESSLQKTPPTGKSKCFCWDFSDSGTQDPPNLKVLLYYNVRQVLARQTLCLPREFT